MSKEIKKESTDDISELSDTEVHTIEAEELLPNNEIKDEMLYDIYEIKLEESSESEEMETYCSADFDGYLKEDDCFEDLATMDSNDSCEGKQNVQLRSRMKVDNTSYIDIYKKLAADQFVCMKCTNSQTFKDRQSVVRHIRKEHYGIAYQCPVCKTVYEERSTLKKHFMKKHKTDIANWKSEQCLTNEEIIKETGGDSKHSKNMFYGESFTKICLKCTNSKKYRYTSELYHHIRYAHYNITLKCPQCNKECSEQQTLKKHLKELHRIDIESLKLEDIRIDERSDQELNTSFEYGDFYRKVNEDYFCIKCTNSNKFSSWVDIARHISNEHYVIRYKCIQCKMDFKEKHILKNHLMADHEIDFLNLEPKDYLRKIRIADLKNETRINVPTKQFSNKLMKRVENYFVCLKCAENSSKYKNVESITRHLRQEHYDIIYACTECKNKYKCKPALKEHLRKKHQFDIDNLSADDVIRRAAAYQNHITSKDFLNGGLKTDEETADSLEIVDIIVKEEPQMLGLY